MITGSPSTKGGFTLLELMLALALLGIVMYKGLFVVSNAVKSSSEVTTDVIVEDQARKVLNQIAALVMSSDRDSLNPVAAAPLSSEDIGYRVNLGLQDGEIVRGDPELIGMEEDIQQVFWSKNPETPEEVRVVWSNLVAPYLEGEIPNGMDDNGNGLIDEKGLSFVIDRNAVTIRLTLDRVVEGRPVTKTVQTTVTCRNLDVPEVP